MVFSSVSFLFLFLPIFFLFYITVPKIFKNIIILFSSLLFYFWGEGIYLSILLIYVIINYTLGILIERNINNYKLINSKNIVTIGILLNISILLYYKYYYFIINIFTNNQNIGIHLPIGISFYTFQSISYLIDVSRRDVNAEKNPLNFGMYIALFPQLIAGPIVRYIDISSEIVNRNLSMELFKQGIERFIIGLAKKVLIANPLGLYADEVFSRDPNTLQSLGAWMGILAYTLQIYYDFSGYSDMAIGLGRMMGFHFLENFNYPYTSHSIKEFWRRWHISLSSWFRDYLYIPLGGNKKSNTRTYLNLLLVFILCGLWHGANYTFLFWGAWHGLFLVLERGGLDQFLEKRLKVIQWIYTFLVVSIGWVFFRALSIEYGISYTIQMLSFKLNGDFFPMGNRTLLVLFLGILFSYDWSNYFKTIYISNSLKSILLLILFLLSISNLAVSTYNPFIYFRF
jgi:alginate O-acetyltransferase complex protein AlgI